MLVQSFSSITKPIPAAQRNLSRSIWHIKMDLQLMLLLNRKRGFPKRHFSRKILQKLKDSGCENLKGLTDSLQHNESMNQFAECFLIYPFSIFQDLVFFQGVQEYQIQRKAVVEARGKFLSMQGISISQGILTK